MFKQILTPFDGSRLSERSMPLACALARAARAQVHLLRSTAGMSLPALPAQSAYESYYGPFGWLPTPEVLEQIRAGARDSLAGLVHKYNAHDLVCRQIVVDGDPAGAIVDYAHDLAVDLIVMSSHGLSGLERWALGSVTERVLHEAPCPVLVAREPHKPRRILVPLDGSPLAERALEPALELARLLEASVTLLRVERPAVVDPAVAVRLEQIERGLGENVVQGIRERSDTYLNNLRLQRQAPGLRLHTVVLEGRAAPAIIDYAAKHEHNLIAMATHGRTGLSRWIYGSVTEKVLRMAPCSLFIVRPPMP